MADFMCCGRERPAGITAGSGAEVFDFIEDKSPELILLDIMMPHMDGYEVCRKIKSNEKTADIPVIFLTAKSQTIDLIRGFEAGGIDYVTKPYESFELLVRIKTHMDYVTIAFLSYMVIANGFAEEENLSLWHFPNSLLLWLF